MPIDNNLLLFQDYEYGRKLVDRFVRRFDESYRKLAAHAALPLLLTPELLGYLRVQFASEAPWVAEADLLLSDLCRPVGYEQYAIDIAARAYLLDYLKREFSVERMAAVARLLISYIHHLTKSNPMIGSHELQAQQWSAMVYLDDQRETAVREIAEAIQTSATPHISNLSDRLGIDQAELARLAYLIQTLAPQLEPYPELVEYAEQLTQLLSEEYGDSQLYNLDQPMQVLDVELPSISILVGRHATEVAQVTNISSEPSTHIPWSNLADITDKYQILLMPKDNYYDWVEAAKEYVLKFGARLTPNPDSAARFMIPQQIITIAGAPDGYPAQGDIQTWFRANYPSIRTDFIPVASPAEFKAALEARLAANDRYLQSGAEFKLLWPTDHAIVNQAFGANPDLYRRWELPGHEGIDIHAPRGSKVYACADGTVVLSDAYRGDPQKQPYGNSIRIRHRDGYLTLYAHLQQIFVKVGDFICAGQVIGLANSTGNSTANSLHLGLKKEGATAAGLTNFPKDILDPTPFLFIRSEPVNPGTTPASQTEPKDIVDRYFDALNSGDPAQVLKLYQPNAGHVTAKRTVVGLENISKWYMDFLKNVLPGAHFKMTNFSGTGNSRHFQWTAAGPTATIADGEDTLGLRNDLIQYHYTSFTITPRLTMEEQSAVQDERLPTHIDNARQAIGSYEQSLKMAREIGDRIGEGQTLGNLGATYMALGEMKRAIEFYEQSLEIAREIGDRRGEGNVLGSLGNAYAGLGETKRAIEFYEQSSQVMRETGDMTISGDIVGRDKITINTGSSGTELADIFHNIHQQIYARQPDPQVKKEEIIGRIERIQQEVAKGEKANERKLERWLRDLAEMAPDIFDVTVAALTNPAVAVGMVVKKVAEKAKSTQ